ncbi:MAG TPA: DUF3971 domain-containing protein [Xanthobacteraceae bacterium]|nr:DUF3971 domain-containing protein [Xanthobacteraceae bacterium]
MIAFATLVAVVGIAFGGLWYRLSSGPIALDFATDWLAAAIKENLGSRYNVQVGGTVLERDENGGMALRIRDIVVRDSDGAVVANAPRAEVGLAKWSIVTGHPRAASLNLVGAGLALRIEPNGEIKVFTGGDRRPLVRATMPPTIPPTMLASADSVPIVASRSIASTATQAAPSAAPVQAAPSTSSARGIFDNLGAVLAWLDSINALGLDGHDLGEIGLKSGSLTVDDQRNGQKSTFDKINLSLTRHGAGEVTLRISSDNPDHPWLLLAGVKPLGEGRRAVSIEARKVMVRDLILALRLGDGGMEPDLPMSLSLRAEIARDGMPQLASGKLWLGPGTITDRKDPSNQFTIDQADVSVDWDASRHSLSAPFQIVSGGNRFTLVAHAEAPAQAGAPWRIGLTGGSIVLAPAPGDDASLQLNRIAVLCRLDMAKRRLDIEHANIAGQNVAVALSGSVDFSTGDPRIAIGAAGRHMTMAAFKQVWPAFVNTPVHVWANKHFVGGMVDRVEIATNAPLSTLQNGGPPVPDDGLSMEIAISGSSLQPVDDLPPIRDADLVTRVHGRDVTLSLGRGVIDLPSGRRLTIANGLFEVPDTQIKKPPARVRMRIEGPVPAAAEFLASDRLRAASGSPLDPAGSRGTVAAQVALTFPIDPDMPAGSVKYNITADVANFSVDHFMMAQRVEAQTLRVTADPDGYQARGEVRIGGMPASIDYRKPRGDGDAELRLQGVFDDAARSRFGFDFNGSLTGPVSVRLGAKIPATGEQDARFAIEADLTQAKIDNLLPGWTKPAAKKATATFTMATHKGADTRIDNIVVDSGGVSVKGSVVLDSDSQVVNANFPVFGMTSEDKASLKAEREADGVLKVTMRGDVYDGRAFVKSIMGGPSSSNPKARSSIGDLDVDVKIGTVAGFRGETLRAVDFRLQRRAELIKSFALKAKIGVDAVFTGDMHVGTDGHPVLYFHSADAGALLRFTDTYPRVVGGQLWATMDPPTPNQTPQQGLLDLRDFHVKGEAALDRVAAGAPSMEPDGVQFSRMRVVFTRSPGKFTVRDAVVSGPVVGATMDGVLDFANNDVRLRGTFVPLYGINNMFGQIPIVGIFLGGGDKEGLFGITFEVVGPPNAPILRVNPISPLAPGLLRKVFEFPSSVPGERYPDPRTSYADRDR